jgi:hypothetical protein
MAVIAGLAAPPAVAGPVAQARSLAGATWIITPGGNVTGSAGKTTLKDKSTSTSLSCSSSDIAATLKSGSGQTSPIGQITSVTFSNCTGPDGLVFTATTSASPSNPWPLNTSTYSSGVTHGTITNIQASISGAGCSATVAGTTSTTSGQVTVTYTNSTAILKVSGGTLHIWNVSGCFGLINNGDAATFTAAYTVAPAEAITKKPDVAFTIPVKVGGTTTEQITNFPGTGPFTWGNFTWDTPPGPPGAATVKPGFPVNGDLQIVPPNGGWPNMPGTYKLVGSYTDSANPKATRTVEITIKIQK